MTRKILNWSTGAVIWEGDAETVKDAIHAAIAARANLSRANLSRAHLSEANLSEANLSWANQLMPPMVLLANWGDVSDDLCADLMNYDASNHPDGAVAFAAWVAGGVCPYAGCRVARSANFTERKACYRPERPLQSALQLMDRLLAEKTKTIIG